MKKVVYAVSRVGKNDSKMTGVGYITDYKVYVPNKNA